MQKLKYTLLDRLTKEDLTGLEFDFILYLVRVCDETGHAEGVHYKDCIHELCCSEASFYLIRDSLTEKKLITWEKSHTADIDITLQGNNFIGAGGEPDYRNNPYIDTSITLCNDKAFYALRVKAKQMMLHLLKRTAAGRGTHRIRKNRNRLRYVKENQYRIYAKMLHVSVRMVKEYFEDLRRWVKVGRIEKNGTEYDIVTLLESTVFAPAEHIESKRGEAVSVRTDAGYHHRKHFIKTFCRRERIQNNEMNLNDTAALIKQYARKAREAGKNIYQLIVRAIQNVQNGVLNSINIHKALINLIACPAPVSGTEG